MTRTIHNRSATTRSSRIFAIVGLGILGSLQCLGCAGESAGPVTQPRPPKPVVLSSIAPNEVVLSTTMIIMGMPFDAEAKNEINLRGDLSAGAQSKQIDLTWPLAVRDSQRAELIADGSFFSLMGEGTFRGTAQVLSSNIHGLVSGNSLMVSIQFIRHLDPVLSSVRSGPVYLNTRVPMNGQGILLGGNEGQTMAELAGCFLTADKSPPCEQNGRQISAKVPVTSEDGISRIRGYFEFHPSVAGIRPGQFTGTVMLINMHGDSTKKMSDALSITLGLQMTRLDSLGDQAVSLGQYLDFKGAGFVKNDGTGSTVIGFSGTFSPKGKTPRNGFFDIHLAYQDGGWVRHVVEEYVGIGEMVDLFEEHGTLSGTWTPTVYWLNDQVQGAPIQATINIGTVRQMVWVKYLKSWSDGLVLFGLQAADGHIRQQIRAIMERDYRGINIKFQDTEPEDFKLYTTVELSGQDPNGLGLLGYDNTPGKDAGNKRLYDKLGGVNALTQEDGYPGYGGVFVEAMLGFSEHPPPGILQAPIHTPLFDQIFDPFRPDRGKPLTPDEAKALGDINTEPCPAANRFQQAACAIRVVGNVIGSTSAHEVGHALGLANPYEPPDAEGKYKLFHNPGDEPNRLMDGGGARPFDERSELNGKGPAVFCDLDYQYLKKILPLDPPQDPQVERPQCF